MAAEADEDGASGLHAVLAEGPLYRVARVPDPWAWPDWANVGSDGTFGNRWDDPEGLYRVVYASSTPLGAFVEVLARFRPDIDRASATSSRTGRSSSRPG